MTNTHLLDGEYDQYYSAIHTSSVDWVHATTPIELDPGDCNYLITRMGFTVYDTSNDFAQDIKMDFFDGDTWETRFSANNYATLANVANQVDPYKIGTIEMVSFLWHYKNGIQIHGSLGEKMKIYPSAMITNCDHFHCSLRYLKFI